MTKIVSAGLFAALFSTTAGAALAQDLEVQPWPPEISVGPLTVAGTLIVQHDMADYDQVDVLPAGAAVLQDGERFRRARIGFDAEYGENLTYSLLYEFGGSHSLRDGRLLMSAVEYTGLEIAGHSTQITAGIFAPNMGLENAASSSTPLFAERPSSVGVARGLTGDDGRYGVQAIVYDDRWLVSGAVTGGMRGDRDSFASQTNYIARLAYSPVVRDDGRVVVAANISQVARPAYATPGLAATPIRLRDRPESRVDGQRLIDTGNIDADGITIYGLEGAWQRGPLLVMGEYAHYDLERRIPLAGAGDPSFSGWYAQSSYVFGGAARRYRAGKAAFDGPRITEPFNPMNGQWGAFEAVGRVSVMDLNDNEGATGAPAPIGGVRGGKQTIYALGANWYINSYFRLAASYQQVEIDRLDAAGAQIGQDFDAVMLRSQVSF
jgi:phosphate-selective porin OprO/OprP